jgi:hypothetical protein
MASVSTVPPLIIRPISKHTATVIFLHGLGDTGFGWKDEMEGTLRFPHIKYVLPHAAMRPFSFYNGTKMTAWFDRYSMDWDCKEDNYGIEQARNYGKFETSGRNPVRFCPVLFKADFQDPVWSYYTIREGPPT